jgi:hypothetical protein
MADESHIREATAARLIRNTASQLQIDALLQPRDMSSNLPGLGLMSATWRAPAHLQACSLKPQTLDRLVGRLCQATATVPRAGLEARMAQCLRVTLHGTSSWSGYREELEQPDPLLIAGRDSCLMGAGVYSVPTAYGFNPSYVTELFAHYLDGPRGDAEVLVLVQVVDRETTVVLGADRPDWAVYDTAVSSHPSHPSGLSTAPTASCIMSQPDGRSTAIIGILRLVPVASAAQALAQLAQRTDPPDDQNPLDQLAILASRARTELNNRDNWVQELKALLALKTVVQDPWHPDPTVTHHLHGPRIAQLATLLARSPDFTEGNPGGLISLADIEPFEAGLKDAQDKLGRDDRFLLAIHEACGSQPVSVGMRVAKILATHQRKVTPLLIDALQRAGVPVVVPGMAAQAAQAAQAAHAAQAAARAAAQSAQSTWLESQARRRAAADEARPEWQKVLDSTATDTAKLQALLDDRTGPPDHASSYRVLQLIASADDSPLLRRVVSHPVPLPQIVDMVSSGPSPLAKVLWLLRDQSPRPVLLGAIHQTCLKRLTICGLAAGRSLWASVESPHTHAGAVLQALYRDGDLLLPSETAPEAVLAVLALNELTAHSLAHSLGPAENLVDPATRAARQLLPQMFASWDDLPRGARIVGFVAAASLALTLGRLSTDLSVGDELLELVTSHCAEQATDIYDGRVTGSDLIVSQPVLPAPWLKSLVMLCLQGSGQLVGWPSWDGLVVNMSLASVSSMSQTLDTIRHVRFQGNQARNLRDMATKLIQRANGTTENPTRRVARRLVLELGLHLTRECNAHNLPLQLLTELLQDHPTASKLLDGANRQDQDTVDRVRHNLGLPCGLQRPGHKRPRLV